MLSSIVDVPQGAIRISCPYKMGHGRTYKSIIVSLELPKYKNWPLIPEYGPGPHTLNPLYFHYSIKLTESSKGSGGEIPPPPTPNLLCKTPEETGAYLNSTLERLESTQTSLCLHDMIKSYQSSVDNIQAITNCL